MSFRVVPDKNRDAPPFIPVDDGDVSGMFAGSLFDTCTELAEVRLRFALATRSDI